MNFLLALGNAALSVACSILDNMTDRYIQKRIMRNAESPKTRKKSSHLPK